MSISLDISGSSSDAGSGSQELSKTTVIINPRQNHRGRKTTTPKRSDQPPPPITVLAAKTSPIKAPVPTEVRIVRPPSSPISTYAMIRNHNVSVKGSSYTFKFFKLNQQLFAAKSKLRYPDCPIPINIGTEIHLGRGAHEFFLNVSPDLAAFTLHPKSLDSNPILEVKTFPSCAPLHLPRRTDLKIIGQTEAECQKLTSKMPKLGKIGVYYLDFHNRFTIPSIKNSIFVERDKDDESDVLCVRKTGTDSLEIDCMKDFQPSIVMGIALSIFVAKLK